MTSYTRKTCTTTTSLSTLFLYDPVTTLQPLLGYPCSRNHRCTVILAATKLMSSRPAKFKNDRKNMFPERFRKYRLVICFMTPKPEDGAFDRVNRSSPSLPTPSKTKNKFTSKNHHIKLIQYGHLSLFSAQH